VRPRSKANDLAKIAGPIDLGKFLESFATWRNYTSEKARRSQYREGRANLIRHGNNLDANCLTAQIINSEEVKNKSSRTRDESQQIAGQAYSHAYNTPFKSSRLQGISVCHSNRFNSNATPGNFSRPEALRTRI
jgi:hypothetical protein